MSGGGEEVVDSDIELDNQQTHLSKSRLHLLRASAKDSAEVLENDAVISCTSDKNIKFLNNQRCSNRLTKRLRIESSPVDPTVKKSVSKQTAPSISSKTRRPWELWSVEDKNVFFEALCEYGKDFESMQSYIALRSKKKGVATNMIKNKDQVRHFYYRTWHKISKFLEINQCVRKQTQEIYGLINYAELRKKIGSCLSEKNRHKLNELVFSGVTTVKYKGKRLRIKTPVCRALKRLNNVADTKEPETEKLPKDIDVEFRPHTNSAWLHVQNASQNPRLRTKVCLQKRLKPVIEYLQKRWKPYRLKRKEHILSSLPIDLSQEIPCDNPPVLRVKPARNAKIYPLSLSIMDVASSSDVCLEKYMKLFHKTHCKDISKTKNSFCLNQKILSDKQSDCCEIVGEKTNAVAESVTDCTNNNKDLQELYTRTINKNNLDDPSYINILTPPKSVPEELSCEQSVFDIPRPTSLLPPVLDTTNINITPFSFDLTDKRSSSIELNFRTFEGQNCRLLEESLKNTRPFSGHESDTDSIQFEKGIEKNMTLGEFINLNTKGDNILTTHATEGEKLPIENPASLFTDDFRPNRNDGLYYKTVRNGWTVDESGFLTFGELYLLLGKPTTIVLEYEFESPDGSEGYFAASKGPSNKSNVLSNVLKVAQNFFMDTKNKQILGKHRNSTKATKMKLCNIMEKPSKEYSLPQLPLNLNPSCLNKMISLSKENSLKNNSTYMTASSISSTDQHVFAMPVGTAPRTLKPTDQTSLQEEIGKLLPGTRRGCRVRRKPLVVQRPLLPRDGMPRPVALVHFMPTISSLTTVLPSNCSKPENKITIAPAKTAVKILPGSSIDMHPLSVPIVKHVHSDSTQNLIYQQNPVSASCVIVNSTCSISTPIQDINNQSISCLNVTPVITSKLPLTAVEENLPPTGNKSLMSEIELSSSGLDIFNLDILSESQKSSIMPEDQFVTMQQMSMLDASNSNLSNITPSVCSTFLEGLRLSSASKQYDSYCSPISFNEESHSTSKRNTPPGSPTNQPFCMNSPEMQWLNGESTELSLNTLLNSIESPIKVTSSSTTSNSSTENSNLDPIARLAPVVDSQVRCLLDECSIDFITKFEDLADVINNSSSNDDKHS